MSCTLHWEHSRRVFTYHTFHLIVEYSSWVRENRDRIFQMYFEAGVLEYLLNTSQYFGLCPLRWSVFGRIKRTRVIINVVLRFSSLHRLRVVGWIITFSFSSFILMFSLRFSSFSKPVLIASDPMICRSGWFIRSPTTWKLIRGTIQILRKRNLSFHCVVPVALSSCFVWIAVHLVRSLLQCNVYL